MDKTTLAIVIIAIAAIAIVGFTLWQRSRTRKLKATFGPEYDLLVEQEGNAARAEALLQKRQQQVAKYNIRPLTPEERDQCSLEWHKTQERFVDDPRKAVADADDVINRALRARGYPMSDFDRQAADLSVEHPMVVEHYRNAHRIAERSNVASTEDLRLAMQHYRSLLEDVLDMHLVHTDGHANAKSSF